MQRWIPVLVLLALLALLFALNTLARDWRYIVSAQPPGALLYAATFDGGEGFNDEWEQYEGRLSATVVDGALRLSDSDPGGDPFSVAAPRFSDFDLRVRASYREGPVVGGLEDGFGVIFRLRDKGNDNFTDNDYYLFLISADGFYRVSRYLNGERRVLSEWIDTPLINQGVDAVNDLRVVASGNTFRFFINGEAVPLCIPDDPNALSTYSMGQCIGGTMQDTLTDTLIDSGQLGVVLVSAVTDVPEVAVTFDNVLVYAPEFSNGG